jgi:hypothetical protein
MKENLFLKRWIFLFQQKFHTTAEMPRSSNKARAVAKQIANIRFDQGEKIMENKKAEQQKYIVLFTAAVILCVWRYLVPVLPEEGLFLVSKTWLREPKVYRLDLASFLVLFINTIFIFQKNKEKFSIMYWTEFLAAAAALSELRYVTDFVDWIEGGGLSSPQEIQKNISIFLANLLLPLMVIFVVIMAVWIFQNRKKVLKIWPGILFSLFFMIVLCKYFGGIMYEALEKFLRFFVNYGGIAVILFVLYAAFSYLQKKQGRSGKLIELCKEHTYGLAENGISVVFAPVRLILNYADALIEAVLGEEEEEEDELERRGGENEKEK